MAPPPPLELVDVLLLVELEVSVELDESLEPELDEVEKLAS